MRSLFYRLAGAGLAACLLPLAMPASANYTLRCESSGNRYNYCNANTDGRVRMVERLSKNGCRQGRDWGYDWNGVWVSNGCRAKFEVGGRKTSGGGGGRDDAGKAAVAVGGLAILGAIIANANKEETFAAAPVAATPAPVAAPPAWNGDRPDYVAVPPWAIGTFDGRDAYSGVVETISIDPNGGVARYTPGAQPLYGNFSDGQIVIQGRAAAVQEAAGGIMLRGALYRRQ